VVKEPLNYFRKLECAKLVATLRFCTFAVGVLEAEIMASCISCLAGVVALKCRWTWESLCFGVFRREDMAVRDIRKEAIMLTSTIGTMKEEKEEIGNRV
jgi:hypothetical protein